MKMTEKEIELYRTYLLEQVKKNHNECVKNGELKYCNNGGFYSEYGCFDDENDKSTTRSVLRKGLPGYERLVDNLWYSEDKSHHLRIYSNKGIIRVYSMNRI